MRSLLFIVLVLFLASLLALAENLPEEQKTFLHNLKKIGATKSELDTLSVLLKTNAPPEEIQKKSDSIIRRTLSKLTPEQQKTYYELSEKDKLEYLASGDTDGWIRKRDKRFVEKICETREGKILYYSLKDLLEKDELREFIKQDSSGREEWLKKYWATKDPTPTTSKNEWKEEFDKRLEFILDNFHSTFGVKPWDDRGDILLKLGLPEERELSAESSWKAKKEAYKGPVVDTEEEFYKSGCEVWTYFLGGKEVHFQFEDMKFTGYLALVPYRSASRIENLDYMSTFNVQFAELDQSQAVYRHDYKGKPMDFAWEVIKFRSLNNVYEILVNVGIPVDKIGRDSTGTVHYDQQIAIRNGDGEIIRCDTNRVAQKIPNVEDQILVDQKQFLLTPGVYSVALQIRDHVNGKIGLYQDNLFLPSYTDTGSTLSLSRAILSSKIIESPSGNENDKFYLNGYRVYPNPGHVFFKEQEHEIKAYFEVYNLQPKNDTLEFATISYIIKYTEGDSALVTSDTSITVHSGFRPDMVAYQILPLLDSSSYLEPGDYIWRIDVIDLNAPHKTESIVNRLKIKS